MTPSIITPARSNPFAVDRTDAIPFRFEHGGWSEHLQRLTELKYRAAVIGPQGSGKSSLLRQLVPRLHNLGLQTTWFQASRHAPLHDPMRSAENERLVSKLGPGRVLIVDSAEQLPKRIWWRLVLASRHTGGLVVAVHHRCLLPTWFRCRTSWELLGQLLDDLKIRSSNHRVYQAAHAHLVNCRGNVRETLRALYDEVALGTLCLDGAGDQSLPHPEGCAKS